MCGNIYEWSNQTLVRISFAIINCIFWKLLIQSYESAQHNPDVYQQKAKQACEKTKRKIWRWWIMASSVSSAFRVHIECSWIEKKNKLFMLMKLRAKGDFRNIFISILITFITQLYEFISWCSCSRWDWQRRHAGGIESHRMSLCCAFYIPELSPLFGTLYGLISDELMSLESDSLRLLNEGSFGEKRLVSCLFFIATRSGS